METFHGIKDNTARNLFEQLKGEGYDVDWAHFYRWACRQYALPNSKNWIPAGVFVRYFSREIYSGEVGQATFKRLLVLYGKKNRRTYNAYDDNGNGSANGKRGSSKASSSKQSKAASPKALKAGELRAIRSEIELLDKLIALRNEAAA